MSSETRTRSLRSIPNLSNRRKTLQNIINIIGKAIGGRMDIKSIGELKEIRMEFIGSAFHPDLLKIIQHKSEQQRLLSFPKGTSDYYLLYATEILAIWRPSDMLKLYDEDGQAIYFREDAKIYVDDLYDNYPELNEIEIIIRLYHFSWRMRYKYLINKIEAFMKKVINAEKYGDKLPVFDESKFNVKDWDHILPAKVVFCGNLLFGINTRSGKYDQYGKAKIFLQSNCYWISRDLVIGKSEIIEKVISKVKEERLQQEYDNHPLANKERQRYKLDDGSFDIFEKAMEDKLKKEISKIKKYYN